MAKFCSNCGNNKFKFKNVYLPVKEIDNKDDIKSKILDILPIKNELFYMRICLKCGKVEFFDSSIIDESAKKVNLKKC